MTIVSSLSGLCFWPEPDIASRMSSESPSIAALSFLHGSPPWTGLLRHEPEDFVVDEDLGFEPDGEGQHRLLRIEKRNTNTEWLARQIARYAGVAARDVGFAGLKDRRAVTTQWFSVDLAGKPEPDWSAFSLEGVRILEVAAHGRKLRRGSLKGNRFRLRIREVVGDREALASRLDAIADQGVPNYFMEQRFGRGDANLEHAATMFDGRRVRDRHKRGLYLSAARSLLFNRVLSERIARGLWGRIVPGDVLMLDGTHSIFAVEDAAEIEKLERRLAERDLHLTGPLWGRGGATAEEAAAFEADALLELESWRRGIEQAEMKSQRRALRLVPGDLDHGFEGDVLSIELSLPAGSYATAVLRELLQGREPSLATPTRD